MHCRARVTHVHIHRNRIQPLCTHAHPRYGLTLQNPKEFYHEIHRPGHFLKFEALEGQERDGADREDMFA